MKQKRKVKSLLSSKQLFDKWEFKVLLVAGGCTLFLCALSLFTISVWAALGTSTQLNYEGVDDRLEVLYHLWFTDVDDNTSSDKDYMVMEWKTLYIKPRSVVVNQYESSGWHGEEDLSQNNKVDNNVYSNILWWDYNEVNSKNVTIIAWVRNTVNAWNDNVTVLWWKSNIVDPNVSGNPSVMVWWSGNTLGSGNSNTILWWAGNYITGGTRGSVVLWGMGNVVRGYGEDVIVWWENVVVEGGVSNVFAYSSKSTEFKPESSNAFYLDVDNWLWINMAGVDWVTTLWAVSFGEVNNTPCNDNNIWLQWSRNGCLVWCTKQSKASWKWELLDRWSECEKKCHETGKCLVGDENNSEKDDYGAFCTEENIENAQLCFSEDLVMYENVVFETSVIDHNEACPSWNENKCIYQCNGDSRLREKFQDKCDGYGIEENVKNEHESTSVYSEPCEKLNESDAKYCVPVRYVYKLVGCKEGYHTDPEDTEGYMKWCIGNTRSKQCIEWRKPDNSHYVIVNLLQTWKWAWDSWSWQPDPVADCNWECDSNYHEENWSCVLNSREVDCYHGDDLLPQNAKYTDITKKYFEYWSGSWKTLSNKEKMCIWDCNGGYTKNGDICEPNENVTDKDCKWNKTWEKPASNAEWYRFWESKYEEICVTWKPCTPAEGSPATIWHSVTITHGQWPKACEYTCVGNYTLDADGKCVERTYSCTWPKPDENAVLVNWAWEDESLNINKLYDEEDAPNHPCSWKCGADYDFLDWECVESTHEPIIEPTNDCTWPVPENATLVNWVWSEHNDENKLYETQEEARNYQCSYYCKSPFTYVLNWWTPKCVQCEEWTYKPEDKTCNYPWACPDWYAWWNGSKWETCYLLMECLSRISWTPLETFPSYAKKYAYIDARPLEFSKKWECVDSSDDIVYHQCQYHCNDWYSCIDKSCKNTTIWCSTWSYWSEDFTEFFENPVEADTDWEWVKSADLEEYRRINKPWCYYACTNWDYEWMPSWYYHPFCLEDTDREDENSCSIEWWFIYWYYDDHIKPTSVGQEMEYLTLVEFNKLGEDDPWCFWTCKNGDENKTWYKTKYWYRWTCTAKCASNQIFDTQGCVYCPKWYEIDTSQTDQLWNYISCKEVDCNRICREAWIQEECAWSSIRNACSPRSADVECPSWDWWHKDWLNCFYCFPGTERDGEKCVDL